MKITLRRVISVIAAFGVSLALLAVPASADQPIPRIGVLFPVEAGSPAEAGLRQGLRDYGYSEGVNLVIERRRTAETAPELKALAADLARSGVDLIVVFTTLAAQAALEATTVPVIVLAGDPVAAGLAVSLARPAGNSTGVSLMTTELTAKRIELLHQMAPNARRIVVLMNSSNPTAQLQLDEGKRGAGVLGLRVVPSDVHNAAQLDAALRRLDRRSVDAVLVTGDLFLMSNRAKIAEAIRSARLPAIYPNRRYHDEGALISYGPDVKEAARRLASFVDRILKGARPGDLPFEQVAKFELVVNLKTAKTLGIAVPESILLQADEVIR